MGYKFCEKTGASIDNYLKEFLDHGLQAVNNKWDNIMLIDGVEGSGKSGLGVTCAYYLDRNFTVDNIVFTPAQFIEAVDKSKPGQAILWDEFVLGGLSDDALKSIQITIIKYMVTIRKKRLHIILIIPFIFMLRTYFGVARSRLLIHTSTPDGIKRGYWKVWNWERKKDLYFKGKKFFDYCVPHIRRGYFENAENWPVIDWDAYQKKKDEATKTISELDGRKQEGRYRTAIRRVVYELYHDKMNDYNSRTLAKLCGVSQKQITNLVREQEEKNEEENKSKTTPGLKG
jgi:hypothetical protein